MIQPKKYNTINKQPKSDYEQKLIDLRRVARVVAGGRRFSFRATMVIGNQKGEVGLGIGKGADTALAIEKAVRAAKKRLIHIQLTPNKSVFNTVSSKFSSANVLIKPISGGRGLRAGGSVRTVLYLAGVQNASAKIISPSKNKINNAQAAIEALKKLANSH
ncbi:MAG: hypothetical protein A2909_00355 [Candidatus Tagabacteria bacterium RIFCSPLOWO2_01_FULL_39_11]|uniref:Small ribosomal subunit protein uS5 n=1 Tax=Candidatus Tagabacteria bacterium RIFCSPLOWO2_01_FULL_39_11 TaxID=1802295 RepID=A0A1G2LRI6_9BACT|nr:MAG: hypothetical protein A2909_00355 [Candidatus Tagabacteria bacterium RIFCSPLOWO2_01_FULL_39_11]